jgi:serine/threonine protein kinase
MSKRIGKFQVIRTIGSGVSCKAKLGLDLETGKKVAIKIMNNDLSASDQELINAEVTAMKNLDHKHVIKLIEYGSN